jgi:2-keto-4-pentenoate hydratase/2-oxohepta-3-ene-1,7-dioic acid hydratase in catechol pathway
MASSIGPTIATPDEFSAENSKLVARIDGGTWSSGTLSDMHFSFEQIIEFITQEADVVPGDLLGSGTIGMGCGFERDRYLTRPHGGSGHPSERARNNAAGLNARIPRDTRGSATASPGANDPRRASL